MTHTNFLGIPVEGDITPGSVRAEQRPLEEFQPILRRVLDNPKIEAIRWQQYTPYFNDGEPCEFNIYAIYVRPTGHPKSDNWEDEDNYDEDEEEPGFIDHWSLSYSARHENNEENRELYEATKELNDAVSGGAFYDVLLEAFGDHARVTVRKDKIIVEEYEHD